MITLNPYLNFDGITEEAFTFYKSVFGGEFRALQRFKDTPEGDKLPAHEQDKIMHIALPIGKDTLLMATDALESMRQKLAVGNNFYISLETESETEAIRLYNGLSADGTIEVPFAEAFWGSHFGMFADKFGVQWMVSYDPVHDNQ